MVPHKSCNGLFSGTAYYNAAGTLTEEATINCLDNFLVVQLASYLSVSNVHVINPLKLTGSPIWTRTKSFLWSSNDICFSRVIRNMKTHNRSQFLMTYSVVNLVLWEQEPTPIRWHWAVSVTCFNYLPLKSQFQI